MRKLVINRLLLCVCAVIIFPRYGHCAPTLDSIVNKYKTGTIGIAVKDVESNRVIFNRDAERPLKPASVMKIVTSAVALEQLGPEFKFETEFLVDGTASSALRTLYVRGRGDPRLRIEEANLIARELRRKGLQRVGRLVVDSSLFLSEKEKEGQKAYETGSAALSFNFNSLMFEVCPTQPQKPAHVTFDPWELPIELQGSITTKSGGGGTYSIDELASSRGIPDYRLKGAVGTRRGCGTYYRGINHPDLYFGYVFLGLLRRLGVQVPLAPEQGVVPSSAKAFFVHKSSTLKEVVRELNHYSNNFIAEQLLSVVGETSSGEYDRALGVQRFGKYLADRGIKSNEYMIVDASGLSHDNRLSARALTSILTGLANEADLSVEFEASLSVGGRSGTLKRRKEIRPPLVVRAKTGTLTGVTTLAGYVYTKSNKKLAFTILQNNIRSKADAERLESQLLRALSQT